MTSISSCVERERDALFPAGRSIPITLMLGRPMLSPQSKRRLAICVFDRIEPLSLCLNALSDQAGCTEIVLHGAEQALSGELATMAGFRPAGAALPGRIALVRDRADFCTGDCAFAASRLGPEHLVQIFEFDRWMEPRMAARLNRHLADGACLLVAMLVSQDQERSVCGALMNYSVGQLQVHDIDLI